MTENLERMLRAFEQFQESTRKAEQRLDRHAEVKAQLAGIEAAAQSPDHGVTVVAGQGGAIKDIRFTEEALAFGPHALGGSVLSTLRNAVAAAARQQATIVQQFVGPDIPILDQVLHTQAMALGTTVDALRDQLAAETGAAPGSTPPLSPAPPLVGDARPLPPPSPPRRDAHPSAGPAQPPPSQARPSRPRRPVEEPIEDEDTGFHMDDRGF